MWSSAYLYACATTELSCRQSRIPKSWVQLANRAILYISTTITTISTKIMFYFSSFTSSWPFLRWPALKSFSSTHRFQLGKTLSTNLYSSSIYHPLSQKLEIVFAFCAVVDVHCCWLFFSFWGCWFFLRVRTCYLLRGIVAALSSTEGALCWETSVWRPGSKPYFVCPYQHLQHNFLYVIFLLGSNATDFRVSCFFLSSYRECISHVDVVEVSRNRRLRTMVFCYEDTLLRFINKVQNIACPAEAAETATWWIHHELLWGENKTTLWGNSKFRQPINHYSIRILLSINSTQKHWHYTDQRRQTRRTKMKAVDRCCFLYGCFLSCCLLWAVFLTRNFLFFSTIWAYLANVLELGVLYNNWREQNQLLLLPLCNGNFLRRRRICPAWEEQLGLQKIQKNSRTQIRCSKAWRVERVEGMWRPGARRSEMCRSGTP